MNRWKKKVGFVHYMNGSVTGCNIPMLGNNYATENEVVNCYECKKFHKGELLKVVELCKSGYAGVMPNGNIVDRRNFPKAIPIQENSLFGTPKPKNI